MQQLGSEVFGTEFVLASIPGRPYNVGFEFRIISATASDFQDVETVTVYKFNSGTCAYVTSTELLPTTPYSLGRGQFLEYAAGVNEDTFAVVFIKCSDRCQVVGL